MKKKTLKVSFSEKDIVDVQGQDPVISGRLLELLTRYQERTGIPVPMLFRSFCVTGLCVNEFKMENPQSPFNAHNVVFMTYCAAIQTAANGGRIWKGWA